MERRLSRVRPMEPGTRLAGRGESAVGLATGSCEVEARREEEAMVTSSWTIATTPWTIRASGRCLPPTIGRAWSAGGDSVEFPSPTPMPLPPPTPTRPSTRRIELPASNSSFEAAPAGQPTVRTRCCPASMCAARASSASALGPKVSAARPPATAAHIEIYSTGQRTTLSGEWPEYEMMRQPSSSFPRM